MRHTKRNRKKYLGSYGVFKASKATGLILKIVAIGVLAYFSAPLFPYVIVFVILWNVFFNKD